jgi:hypothetical protein
LKPKNARGIGVLGFFVGSRPLRIGFSECRFLFVHGICIKFAMIGNNQVSRTQIAEKDNDVYSMIRKMIGITIFPNIL